MLWDWCHGLMGFHQAWSYVGIAGNEVDRRGSSGGGHNARETRSQDVATTQLT